MIFPSSQRWGLHDENALDLSARAPGYFGYNHPPKMKTAPNLQQSPPKTATPKNKISRHARVSNTTTTAKVQINREGMMMIGDGLLVHLLKGELTFIDILLH